MPGITSAHDLVEILRAGKFEHHPSMNRVLLDYFSHTMNDLTMSMYDKNSISWNVLWRAYTILLIHQHIPPENLDKCMRAKQLNRFFELHLPRSVWANGIGMYKVKITSKHIVLPIPDFCSNCLVSTDLLRCDRCKTAYYCGRNCQTADWIMHRFVCLPELGD